ncbi:cation diffusion facilitator family transporter [Fonticella tunisiensis]|uniref:Cation diffusion facilitator family transporter n=1 Tax=Fonticella tunisiensis TaxID=1096341 RepID=A0A4R7KSY5_9CLOT|nr:cation diffusion facilitator family transporter [Fonticella tunisiensis]TDT60968.1 cation diffusion facilitator family transporter [Fonticella tunisiensis]
MLTSWIIKTFIPKNINNKRRAYGYLGGIVGITVNILLFISKLLTGIILNSIAITADAFNNLSDVGSSVITIIGFKIADKPADKDHPFGHGRGEYIAGLIISFMVLLVGFQFIKSSYGRIVNPVRLSFDLVSFLILLLSIIAKAWLGTFNRRLAKEISSGALNASSFDSFSDVIVTSTVASSLLISRFTTFPVDGYIGLVVSAFILYAGYNLVKETISPLLGEAPDPELINAILDSFKEYKEIIGTHELIVHSYGTGKYIATIHAEIPSSIPVLEAHEIIDKAENKISKKLGILLIIHMDPVNTDDGEIEKTRSEIEEILKEFPEVISFHDFRFVGQNNYKNILFDIVVSNKIRPEMEKDYVNSIKRRIKEKYPDYNAIIGLDRDYLQI